MVAGVLALVAAGGLSSFGDSKHRKEPPRAVTTERTEGVRDKAVVVGPDADTAEHVIKGAVAGSLRGAATAMEKNPPKDMSEAERRDAIAEMRKAASEVENER